VPAGKIRHTTIAHRRLTELKKRFLLAIAFVLSAASTEPILSAQQNTAAALGAAFAKTLSDKIFLREAEKGKLEITPIYGETIQRIVNEFLGMPLSIKEKLKRSIKPSS
jgi:hypothetical protein